MRVYLDYPVILVQLTDVTSEEAARTAETQGVPVVTGDADVLFPVDFEGPRRGEFEFLVGRVQHITLDFAATCGKDGRLTDAQTEEVVRMAKLFPPGTIVSAMDAIFGIWTVVVDQDGVTKEYTPLSIDPSVFTD